MSIIKSEQKLYNCKTKKITPVWKFDTSSYTVYHYKEESSEYEITCFHTDYVMAHVRYSVSKYPDRLKRLVNSGTIIEYLDDLETKAIEAVDRQVEKWKASDKEYLVAVQCGDIVKAAQLANCLTAMAKEIIFECMIYV